MEDDRAQMTRMTIFVAFVLAIAACDGRSERLEVATDGSSARLVAAADSLYQDYGQALRTGDRGRIAQFYSARGAWRVLNGHSAHLTRATIDSGYRYNWSPPAFFTWDSLQFDFLAPSRVLVVGRFRWQSVGQADTGSYAYAGILEAADSGMVISFEHETRLAPTSKRP